MGILRSNWQQRVRTGIWGAVGLVAIIAAPLALASTPAPVQGPEVLVYVAVVAVKPMQEIARIIEQRERVRVTITQGNSDELFDTIRTKRTGDLYLPGSATYRHQYRTEEMFGHDVLVGHNVAALIVPKGNPKRVAASVNELLRRDLTVVAANPEASSIGRETRRMLKDAGIFDQVLARSAVLATESRNLTGALRSGHADVILNWRSTAFFAENRPHVDVVDLDPRLARPDPLYLIALKSTRHSDIVDRILSLAAAPEGQAIFRRHGFMDARMNADY
jgi:molybdate transport system substrate-binding protein